MDALDAHEVASVDVGAPYRKRFGNPYAVIHRADIHLSILEAVRANPRVRFHTSTQVRSLEQDEAGAAVSDQNGRRFQADVVIGRSEEHTSELQSLMRISYAVFCLKKKTNNTKTTN